MPEERTSEGVARRRFGSFFHSIAILTTRLLLPVPTLVVDGRLRDSRGTPPTLVVPRLSDSRSRAALLECGGDTAGTRQARNDCLPWWYGKGVMKRSVRPPSEYYSVVPPVPWLTTVEVDTGRIERFRGSNVSKD